MYRAARDRSRMHMEQVISDSLELSAYLGRRFNQRKITLVGHSWGAEGERISYDWTLAQARAAGDLGVVRKLKEIGPPPYGGDWRRKFMTQRRPLGRYGGECYRSRRGAFGVVIKNRVLSPEYTLVDRINYFRGIFDSVGLLLPELLTVDLFDQVPRVDVPLWFMLGRHDYAVPSVLAHRYFDRVTAPAKTLVWFENSSHLPNTKERELFNKTLVDRLRPVALRDS